MKNGHTAIFAKQYFPQQYLRNTKFGFSALALTLSLVTGLFGQSAEAGDMSLLVNGKAIHINVPEGKDLNEKNWGLGMQYDWDVVNKKWVPFAAASGFSDSNRNPSYYAGGGAMRRFQFDDTHVDIGLFAFVMTRKDFRSDQPFLGALPVFSVGTSRFSVNMTFIPKVHPKAVPLWFFQLKVSLSNFL